MKAKTALLYFVCITVLFTLMIPLPAHCQRGRDAGDQDYYALLKRLKNNDMSIDFQALRVGIYPNAGLQALREPPGKGCRV